MEHEMRLAVIPYDGDAHPMVMPYCVGCGWVGERRYTFTAEPVAADWRMHITKFNLRERAEGAIDLLLEARAGDEGA